MMDPWQQRVVEEHAQLDDKCVRLAAFICSAAFDELPPDDRTLLSSQFGAMAEYRSVLRRRIARFEVEKA